MHTFKIGKKIHFTRKKIIILSLLVLLPAQTVYAGKNWGASDVPEDAVEMTAEEEDDSYSNTDVIRYAQQM